MRAPLVNLASSLLSLIAAPVVAVKAAVARRRIVGYLSGFDDHLLRDIGLTRADIDSVIGDSLLNDPTHRLALMAGEARTGRRAAAREQLRWARMVDETEGHASAEIDRRAA